MKTAFFVLLTASVLSSAPIQAQAETERRVGHNDAVLEFYQTTSKSTQQDPFILASHPSASDPPIPLWPPNAPIPGERPGAIGKESVECHDGKACQNRFLHNVTTPTLLPFWVPGSDAAMIIAPGGSYQIVAIDLEGIDLAIWLNSIGISALVLKYRVPGRSWLPFGRAPLMDAQRAMGLLRQLATTTHPHLNASKIGFMGFSAGGHLTGHINVEWANRSYPPVDDADKVSCRPDFSIMVYPWKSVSQAPVSAMNSTAGQVTNMTPPTFASTNTR